MNKLHLRLNDSDKWFIKLTSVAYCSLLTFGLSLNLIIGIGPFNRDLLGGTILMAIAITSFLSNVIKPINQRKRVKQNE